MSRKFIPKDAFKTALAPLIKMIFFDFLASREDMQDAGQLQDL